jgi:site-specific recombinase
MASTWDLTALINAADPKAAPAERHLWLVRSMEWLRHASAGDSPAAAAEDSRTPRPVLRLKHLLNQLERHEALRDRVRSLMAAFWRDIDAASLFADLGFGARVSFSGELKARLQARLLPGTPATRELSVLFSMLFEAPDSRWIEALDETTAARAAKWLGPPAGHLHKAWLEALTRLVSTVQAAAFTPALRERMDPAQLGDQPFHRLAAAAAALQAAIEAGDPERTLREAAFLRALLDQCRRAAASVMPHLEQHGVSVDIVYDLDQLQGRLERIERLLDSLLAPDDTSAVAEGRRLLLELLAALGRTQGLRSLFAEHYSLLARQVAERSAETGEHYITRDRTEYRDMLRRAAGGGAVIAGTVFAKFAIAAIGLTAFWGGFWAGVNYALSFVLIMLLHWTVATKQPAMTAAAMAATLPAGSAASDDEIESFVDKVAQLIRSQVAGIVGNLAACAPLVLLVQWAALAAFGSTAIDAANAQYVLKSQTLLGPTAFFAAFTGILLFASSLIAGWAENWFVFHRMDSAIAWNPRIVATLGPARAQRWALWWRRNVSGLAGNVSLGMMLGLVPALLAFVGLPIEVRHVTLATGQLAAAASALGWSVLATAAFWWCAVAIVFIGVLNLGVSFGLAFKVALRSRGVRVKERGRIYAALRSRLRAAPLSFLLPPASKP